MTKVNCGYCSESVDDNDPQHFTIGSCKKRYSKNKNGEVVKR